MTSRVLESLFKGLKSASAKPVHVRVCTGETASSGI